MHAVLSQNRLRVAIGHIIYRDKRAYTSKYMVFRNRFTCRSYVFLMIFLPQSNRRY